MHLNRGKLERFLGVSSVLFIASLFFLPVGNYLLAYVFPGRWLNEESVWFFLVFFVGTLLGILVFGWLYLVSKAYGNAVFSWLYPAAVVVLMGMNTLLCVAFFWPEFLPESEILKWFGLFLGVLVLVFFLQQVLLFKFFFSWFESRTLFIIGAIGYMIMAMCFVFFLLPASVASKFLALLKTGDVAQPRMFELYGLLFGMMMYFFIVLLPWYLLALGARKNFKISPWMNAAYFNAGALGLVGYVSTVYYLI